VKIKYDPANFFRMNQNIKLVDLREGPYHIPGAPYLWFDA
jgi:hypothetical protein